MGFDNNYTYKFEIGDDEENLLPIAGGITSHDTDFSEDEEEEAYYDLNGGKEKYYTGITAAYSYSGHRKFADKAQEYIRDKVFKLTGRDCFFKVTEPDGRIISGEATIGGIKISGGDANARSDFECTITFKGLPKDEKPNEVEVTGVTLNKTTLSLAVGANETLAATVAPADATDKTVTYASDDPTIATVTPVQGKVAGVKAGTANIIATTANGKTATCAVTVTSA